MLITDRIEAGAIALAAFKGFRWSEMKVELRDEQRMQVIAVLKAADQAMSGGYELLDEGEKQ
jgi:hypothetical protein